jgi:hypothetical protein
MDWILALVAATCVAFVEVTSAHREISLRDVAGSKFVWIYLSLHGGIALLLHAIFQLVPFHDIALGLASGLSTPVILRARIFWLWRGKNQLSVGPAIATERLLKLVEAEISLRSTVRRNDKTSSLMQGRGFEQLVPLASTMITGSRQTLLLEDQKYLAVRLRELSAMEISNEEKVHDLGLFVQDFMGEEFLETLSSIPEFKVEDQPHSELEKELGPYRIPAEDNAPTPAQKAVERAKDVENMLVGVSLEVLWRRTLELLEKGILGADEEERVAIDRHLSEIHARSDMSDVGKVFALGFAMRSELDSTHFRESLKDLRT